ncbi:MarR family winged helix-turn-helix transcriptional regulator [Chitinophaga nivalis]|uniref:MarR family transcriptional regulator n=1 Tax=Chitinophaga nivalis TaxID=2991709 RepID=A0ABT3IEG4_9BACT|nr:MarR family transcriptional regulator [Chitinophaga nivalis]MCW3467958.1 MarR family transcriptional regulator [Chitinophaga nivalis]MCW3482351.1 MarR family transcriptional regulator [Chitinophaga nivalis]
MISNSTTDEQYEACLAKRPDSLARLLSQLKKDMDWRLTEKIQERGYPHFKLGDMVLLVNIDAHGTINNDLARKAKISKQAMSKVVKKLEATGYISTRKHDTDNRASIIYLTEQGKELMINAWECIEAIQHSYTAIIGETDAVEMKRILLKLHRGIGI